MAHRDELRRRIATHGTQTNEVNRAVYVAVGLALPLLTGRTVPSRSSSSVRARDCCSASTATPSSSRHRREPRASARRRRVARALRGRRPPRCGVHLVQRGLGLPPVGVGWDSTSHPSTSTTTTRSGGSRPACGPTCPGASSASGRPGILLRTTRRTWSRGDMVDDLPRTPSRGPPGPGPDGHVVVLSSWALTYLDPARRADGGHPLAVAGA